MYMRSIATLFLLIIISYPIYFYLNYVLENTRKDIYIQYMPMEDNLLDIQFNYHKVK